MTSAVSKSPFLGHRGASVALWAFRILMATVFILAALMKLSSQPMMVAEFAKVGLGQWFRFFTGALELVGAVAVLVPRTSVYGALVLLVVDIGAFVAQISVLHMDWIHTIVIGSLLGALAYLQRPTAR